MASGRHWPRVAAVLVAALAGVLTGGVAQAHPFGDPLSAGIRSEGPMVYVDWRAAPDDLTALAIELQVLDSGRTFVYQDGALVPEESDPSDIDALIAAPEFADYLVQHIRVRAGGQECAGSVDSLSELGDDGAGLSFACPAPVSVAEVSISTLTDLHEAYRTLATGADGQRHVYTLDDDTAEWSFTPGRAVSGQGVPDGTSPARSALVQISAVLAAVVGAVAVGLVVVRRRRPRPDDGRTTDHSPRRDA